MVSAFFYPLLTGHVLLIALPLDSTDLNCEPFSGTMWRLLMEDDFPVANLVLQGQRIERSHTSLLKAKVVGLATNATADGPPYVYQILRF